MGAPAAFSVPPPTHSHLPFPGLSAASSVLVFSLVRRRRRRTTSSVSAKRQEEEGLFLV